MEFARNAEELDALVEANPDRYPTEFIEEGSFADHLMNTHSLIELTSLSKMPADADQMAQWCLTDDQWSEQVTLAWLAFMHEHSL